MPTSRKIGPWLVVLGLVLLAPGLASHAVDKSGVKPNTVSLPEGPGSIEGLGESFEPTLSDGTAKYALGMTVPPGPGGTTPNLGIKYDSGSGNGPLGSTAAAHSVMRCPETGLQSVTRQAPSSCSASAAPSARPSSTNSSPGKYFCRRISPVLA